MGSARLFGLAAVTLVTGIVAACGEGYGEENGVVPGDDGGTPPGQDGAPSIDSSDAIAPSLNCPLGCLPPAPTGWTGPSAVYDGAHAQKPTACPPLYTQKEREGNGGVAAGTSTCSCGIGSAQGTKCQVSVSSYPGAKCSGTAMNVTKETPATSCVDRAAAALALEVQAPALVKGTCTFPDAKLSAGPITFDRAAVACGLPQYAGCADRPDCVASPIPDAPFTRLCIHKSGDELCPSADYAARFTVFATVSDTRACACSGTPDYESCGTTVTFYSGTGCTGTSNSSTTGVCGGYASVAIDSLGPFTKECTKLVKTGVAGDVTLTEPMTFCCNK